MLRRVFSISLVVLLTTFGNPLVSYEQSNVPPNANHIEDTHGVSMIFIQGGNFMMGMDREIAREMCVSLVPDAFVTPYCNSENDYADIMRIQEPQSIEVASFYIDQYEVTLSSYLKCVDEDVCEDNFLKQITEALQSGDEVQLDIPVYGSQYYDAAIYCAWRGGRLPTEIEWEYAARGEQSMNFPWGNEFDGENTNFCDKNCQTIPDQRWDDGFTSRAPVHSFEAGQSWAGVYNLAGNVAEWTSTRVIDNTGSETDSRIIKGGSYQSLAIGTAAWQRYTGYEFSAIGFRCARTTKP